MPPVSSRVHFRIEGLSLEKLLNLCLDQGVKLGDVRRPTVRSISASCAVADYPFLETLAEKKGWKLSVLRTRGPKRWKAQVLRRGALAAGVLLFFALAWAMGNCIWQIEINNGGAYLGEVRTILREQDIRPGRFRFTVDIEKLRQVLENRLTGLAWVSVKINGSRLIVTCVQGVAAEEVKQGGLPGDVTAGRDGIIESLRVISGTAAVKLGDAVYSGQVLIRGEEKTADGQTRPVRARGEVLAKVWFTGQATVPGTEILTFPDGPFLDRLVFLTPWGEWSWLDAPEYECTDYVSRVLPVGVIFPLWLRQEHYESVRLEERQRDETQLREEAELAALRIAKEKAGLMIEIVDKWAEYSMIEEGCMAKVVLEACIDIAKAPAY